MGETIFFSLARVKYVIALIHGQQSSTAVDLTADDCSQVPSLT